MGWLATVVTGVFSLVSMSTVSLKKSREGTLLWLNLVGLLTALPVFITLKLQEVYLVCCAWDMVTRAGGELATCTVKQPV